MAFFPLTAVSFNLQNFESFRLPKADPSLLHKEYHLKPEKVCLEKRETVTASWIVFATKMDTSSLNTRRDAAL